MNVRKQLSLLLIILFIGTTIATANDRLSPILVDKKIGYIDTTGKVVIEPTFKAGKEFYLVTIQGVGYYVPLFTEDNYFSESVVCVNNQEYVLWLIPLENPYVMIDTAGNIIRKGLKYPVRKFSNGLSVYVPVDEFIHDDRDMEFLYIDKEYKQAFDGIFETASPFAENYAVVLDQNYYKKNAENKGYYYINTQGEKQFNKTFTRASIF